MESNIIESLEELVKTSTAKQLYYFIRNTWYVFTKSEQDYIKNHDQINNIILYYLGYFDVYDEPI